MKHSDLYNQDYDQYDYLPVTVFAAIIGSADSDRYITLEFTRKAALAHLIRYLNMMMDEEVVPQGASEEEVFKAIADNLYQPAEIVECYADNLFDCAPSAKG